LSPVALSTAAAHAAPYIAKFTTGTVVSCTISNLAPLTTYFFRITAVAAYTNVESAFNLDGNGRDVEVSTFVPLSQDITPTSSAVHGFPSAFTLISNSNGFNPAVDQPEIIFRITASTPVAVSLFIGAVGAESYSSIISMAQVARTTDEYAATIPPELYTLMIGQLHYRIFATDPAGDIADTEDALMQISNETGPNTRLDGNGKYQLVHHYPAWGMVGVDFSHIVPVYRPSTIAIRQHSSSEFSCKANEQYIDTSQSGIHPIVAFDFTADGLSASAFNGQVSVTLAYPNISSSIDPLRLKIFYRDQTGAWRLIGGKVDAVHHTVTASTSHFSLYAIFEATVNANFARAREVFITPATVDGCNDVANFGTDASRVEIYDMRGHQVFCANGDGFSPIQWTGRDASGKVVESGGYIAKVKDSSSSVSYQAIIVAK